MMRTKEAPSYQPITIPSIPTAEKVVLRNGTPCYTLNIGEQEVIRMECLFPANSWIDPHPLMTFFAVKMLLEGTGTRSSAQINNTLDRYGAFTEVVHTADYYGITVYTMPKFLPEILPVIADILENASFPEADWLKLLNISRQQLRVNQEQNSWLANAKFKAALYGGESRYGYSQNEKDLDQIQRETVQNFYKDHIQKASLFIFLSGKVSEQTIDLVESHLGTRMTQSSTSIPAVSPPDTTHQKREFYQIERPDSSQLTLRMGARVIGRKHPHYFKLLVTNEILGGYFGSRLMTNIREEKGLTYGISSHLSNLKESTHFVIGTDVKKDAHPELMEEIHKEIKSLQTEKVDPDELERVKNIMAGEFARSLSTAFEISDLHQSIVLNDLPGDFYDNYLDRIRAVTADDIMYIANEMLQVDQMIEVVVG